MFIRSVNVGLPKEVVWKGKIISTGIFKYPTDKALAVHGNNIEGDGQAELDVHGGIDKAIYVYALEYYSYWETFLQKQIELGAFGENITTQGLLDDQVHIGDTYQFGGAILMATQPRMPCYKLGIRFNDARMTKHFFNVRKNGIYFKVIREGTLQKGDRIQLVERSGYDVSIQDVVDNFVSKQKDMDKVRQILEIPMLPPWFRSEFKKMLFLNR